MCTVVILEGLNRLLESDAEESSRREKREQRYPLRKEV
jgi:hypothetical protein